MAVNGRVEYADVPVTVAGDIEGLILSTAPGVAVSGQVVLAEGQPLDTRALRITFERSGAALRSVETIAAMNDDRRFRGQDVFGPHLVRVACLPSGSTLKGVLLRGEDITDVPTAFRAEDDDQLQIVISSRVSTLEGVVRGEGTSPPGDATVYVFGEQRGAWRMSSPRTHKSDAGEDGKFSVSGLAAGRYYAIARGSRGISSGREPGEAFFDSLSKEATAFVIGDDERRTLELRLWRWPELSDLRMVFFALLCSLLSQGQTRDQPARRDQPAAGAVSISGCVQAAGTGAAIQGAVIVLVTAPVMESHSSGRNLEGARIDGRSAMTDAAGGFSFTGVAPVPID